MTTTSSLELPSLSNNDRSNQEEEGHDYHNAITSSGPYSPRNEKMKDVQIEDSPDSGCTARLSKPMKKSGISGASANMLNSIVGAGIIGIPYALKQSGLVAGLLLLVLVAFLTGTCCCTHRFKSNYI